MGHKVLAGLIGLCLVLTVDARSKRLKRQVDPNSDPFGPGSNTGGACRPLPAPTFGTIKCGNNIPFYRCTAQCNQGYIFETGDTFMDKDCDMMTGQFFGGSNFPKCKPGGACRPLPAPTFGTIKCGNNIPFYRCTAQCNQGYIFETGDTSMDKDCDMMTGQFFGGSNFPKCKPSCQDDPRQNCWAYEDVKCIEKYEPWSRKHCPYRCGYCPELPPCMDTINNCDEYGGDICSNPIYGLFARSKCRKYCGICSYPGRNSTVTTAPQSTTKSTVTTHKPSQQQTTLPTLPTGAACQDQLTNCDDFSAESCQGLFKTWALLNCPRRCGYCSGGIDECKDYEDCGRLPDDLCKNSAYDTLVKTSCRKYCGLCTVKATTQQPVVTKVPVATVTSPQNYTDQPPVAIATDVVIDYPDTTATLNASLSHDDIGISSYKWEYMGNLNADIRGLYTDIVQLYDLEVGTYEFKLTITDTIGQTDTIKIKVEVVRANNTCELPLDEGVCNAYLPRFYYNETTQTCESYVYGGCFGNSNNFVTEQQCREFCLGEKTNVTSTTGRLCNKNFDIPVPECCGPICACNHTVEGYVTDASNNATPMANVSVYVSGCYCHPFAFSDDKGHYVMSGLCQDDNTLRFETEGYRSHLETPKYMGNGQYQASAPMEPSSKGPMVTPLNPGNSGTSSSAPQANSNADGQNAMVNPGNVLG